MLLARSRICASRAARVGVLATARRLLSTNEEYLAKNAAAAGVTVLDSGLQYKVLASGPADAPSPSRTDPCECHYEGKLTDGSVFDSSYARGKPTVFQPNQVIKGWCEALQLMKGIGGGKSRRREVILFALQRVQ